MGRHSGGVEPVMKLKLTKHGDYERRIDFHAFGYVVYVVFTEDIARSVNARYALLDVQPTFDAMHCREKGNPYSHIFLRVGNCCPGTIAHESWHAVRYILEDWVGARLENEMVAYHLGYLVDVIHDFRNKLIDNGVGVKSSNKKEVPRGDSQGPTGGLPRVQSRVETAGQTQLETPPSQWGNNSGRCCS
jgi:hypothetical protein